MDLSYNSIWRLIWPSVFCLCISYPVGSADINITTTFNPSPPLINKPFIITANYKINGDVYINSIELKVSDNEPPLYTFSKSNATDPGTNDCSATWKLYLDCTKSVTLNLSTTLVFTTADTNLSAFTYTLELESRNISDELHRIKNRVNFLIQPEEPPPVSGPNKENPQVATSNIGAIVGGVLGVLVVLVIIIGIIYFVIRKQKGSLNNRNTDKN